MNKLFKFIKWLLSLFTKKRPSKNEFTSTSTADAKQAINFRNLLLNNRGKQKYSYVSEEIRQDYGRIYTRKQRKLLAKYGYPMRRYYNGLVVKL